MSNAALLNRVPQRLRNPILPDDLSKRLRSKPSSQHGVLSIHRCRLVCLVIRSPVKANGRNGLAADRSLTRK